MFGLKHGAGKGRPAVFWCMNGKKMSDLIRSRPADLLAKYAMQGAIITKALAAKTAARPIIFLSRIANIRSEPRTEAIAKIPISCRNNTAMPATTPARKK